MQHGFAQRVILSVVVGVGHDDGPLGLGTSDVFDDGQHRRDARARAANRIGDSVGVRTKSPAGALTSSTSPIST